MSDPAPIEHTPRDGPPGEARPPGWLRAHLGLLRADRTTWFCGLAAAVVLTVSRFHGNNAEYHRLLTPEARKAGGLFAFAAGRLFGEGGIAALVTGVTAPIAAHLYWFLSSFGLFFLVPLAAAALTPGIRLKELGVGAGDWRYGLKAVALLYLVMLPFVVVASGTEGFARAYPLARGAADGLGPLLVYEAGYWAYFTGWEFVYRGLLCVALYPRLGAGALLLQAVPFAVMHGGKPELEAYGSIVAALALGVVAVRARSFWYGVLLHGLVASTMDVLSLLRSGRWPGL